MTEIIKTDGTRQPVQPANGSVFTLEEMQAIVGGYIELERQLWAAQFGDIPESLENSREYKAAKQLEYAMNDFGFKPERFAQALPYFHKTLEQTFFRTVKASITAMAGRDPRCIDDRNRASYEMCQTLASMLEDTRLPFI